MVEYDVVYKARLIHKGYDNAEYSTLITDKTFMSIKPIQETCELFKLWVFDNVVLKKDKLTPFISPRFNEYTRHDINIQITVYYINAKTGDLKKTISKEVKDYITINYDMCEYGRYLTLFRTNIANNIALLLYEDQLDFYNKIINSQE